MSTTYNLLMSLVSIFFLIVLVFWLYRDYCIDKFRQKIFKLRDELFDEARKGNVRFEDDAYKLIRNTMNGFIRFAHKLNLIQVVLYMVILRNHGKSSLDPFSEVFKKSISRLSSAEKKTFNHYYLRMNFLAIEYLIFSSPIIMVTVLIPITFFLVAQNNINRLVQTLKSPLDKLDSAALSTLKI